MSRETFKRLCNDPVPHTGRQMTRLRQPISVDACVAITIWRLGTNTKYRTIAALFAIGRSSAREVVLETREVIALHLMPKYVCIPHYGKLLMGSVVCEDFHKRSVPLTGSIFPFCSLNNVRQTTITASGTTLF